MSFFRVFILACLVGCFYGAPGVDREADRASMVTIHEKQVSMMKDMAKMAGLPQDKMEELTKELTQHKQKLDMLQKNDRDLNDVEERKIEIKLRRDLHDIATKYKLIDEKAPAPAVPIGEGMFKDNRLNKIWNRASKSGQFSDLELDSLKYELTEHEERIDEYRETLEQFATEHPPSAEQTDDDSSVILRKIDMKLQYDSLNNELKRLEMRAIPHNEKSGFIEPRVHQMWVEAIRSNFTDEELQSLREELVHFEGKIQQHVDLRDQAHIAAMKYHADKSVGEKVDPKAHEELKDEADNLGYYIKDFVGDMRSRFSSRRHTEL
ncbi:alpha-2-macroglobulin receptor-associated protein-like [Saccoglossus kowalevskii]|uniref:Alpha-2-macroglobulin receptor-associated protein-like n=1 Tax=Saccoglossus kowalevskii TaxID=10224 RepID=A0ABM0LVF4_SACKO|nr:PREDICTED: alpha-2-macroglobulin receptor-associated protein-like [Saccoglossus kowalevskii]